MTKEEFFETPWFKERPESIQNLLRERAPSEKWYLKVLEKDEYYGIVVIGADEYEDQEPTLRIYVSGPLPPLTERQVFGIKKEDLFSAEQVKGKKIQYESWRGFDNWLDNSDLK